MAGINSISEECYQKGYMHLHTQIAVKDHTRWQEQKQKKLCKQKTGKDRNKKAGDRLGRKVVGGGEGKGGWLIKCPRHG